MQESFFVAGWGNQHNPAPGIHRSSDVRRRPLQSVRPRSTPRPSRLSGVAVHPSVRPYVLFCVLAHISPIYILIIDRRV